MTGSGLLIRAAGLAVVLGTAVVVGLGAAVGTALLGHEVLTAVYGEEGIPAIDDTLPMLVAVGSAYLAGLVAGLAVLVIVWRRFFRRR